MSDEADRDGFVPPLYRMTPDEQIKQQSGPGSEGLPGFVVVDPGPRARYRDERGQWRQVDDQGQDA